jgi:hypothetical protein
MTTSPSVRYPHARTHRKPTRGIALAIVLAGGLGQAGSLAQAGFNPDVEVVQVMKEALGNDGFILAKQVGFNALSTLQFATSTDPNSLTFSYSTAPGTT